MDKFDKIALMVVPTGIGATIGGYAGDASTYAQKIAKEIPLIVNPNVVNAAVFSGITEDMLYVEGWCIEQFVKGNIGLIPVQNNKIGVVFDKAIPDDILNIHLNTLNAMQVVYGVDIVGYEITEQPAGIEFYKNEKGISVGSLTYPETLKKAGENLILRGAEALAVVCYFDNPPEDDYENGEGVDIVGGIEAIISHYLSKELLCPCVHAPAFGDVSITTNLVNKKVSAEYITPTFLPCLILGLRNAPLVKCIKNVDSGNCITYKNLHSLCVPCNALGSSVVLDCIKHNIPVIAIKENTTVLDVNKYVIHQQSGIMDFDTYNDYVEFIKGSV